MVNWPLFFVSLDSSCAERALLCNDEATDIYFETIETQREGVEGAREMGNRAIMGKLDLSLVTCTS